MQEYEKTGYLDSDFKLFHISGSAQTSYEFHYHDFHKILLFLSGDVTYCIEGQSYLLEPCDLVLVKAGEVHRPVIHSTAPYERIILYVSNHFLERFSSPDQSLDFCFQKSVENNSHVLRLGTAFKKSRLFSIPAEIEYSIKNPEPMSSLLEQALFLEFMVLLNRTAFHNSMDFVRNDYSNPKVLAVVNYLNAHLSEEFSMDSLSETFFTSKYHLMRIFKEETGYTIYNYLNMKRLLKARSLIESGKSITDACFECGFQNYSTFFRAYKKYFSVSPRESH